MSQPITLTIDEARILAELVEMLADLCEDARLKATSNEDEDAIIEHMSDGWRWAKTLRSRRERIIQQEIDAHNAQKEGRE